MPLQRNAMEQNTIKVLWFGTGEMSVSVLPAVNPDKISIVAFVDDRPEMAGKRFCGKNVITSEQIHEVDFDAVVVCARPVQYIRDKLIAAEVASEKIFSCDFETTVLNAVNNYTFADYLQAELNVAPEFLQGAFFPEVLLASPWLKSVAARLPILKAGCVTEGGRTGALGSDMPIEFSQSEARLLSSLMKFVGNPKFGISFDKSDSKLLTMVPKQGIFQSLLAVKHVIESGIEGAIVECGVWRGGMSILMAGMIKVLGAQRKLYCYDTFAGMTKPGIEDGFVGDGEDIQAVVKSASSLAEVKNNFERAGFLDDNVVFVEGDVLQTLNDASNLPEKIAVLRLDTDMYASTRKQLEVLYPRLSSGGVLIMDDYGAWVGCKTATDEYFKRIGKRPYFNYVDANARVGVKP